MPAHARSPLPRQCLIALSLCCAAVGARAADVYVSFDAQGQASFAATALDDSYRLLFKDLKGAPAGRLAEPPADVKGALQSAASRHGVDYALLYAVAQAESGFDTQAVSPKGAVGVMQLMPDTARRYGITGEDALALKDNMHRLHGNVDAGSRYLSDLLRLFGGDTELAVAAYNAGEGAVQRSGNRIPNYAETRTYVERVMGTYRRMAGGPVASAVSPLATAPAPDLPEAASAMPRSPQIPARMIAAPVRGAGHGGRASVQIYLGATQEIQRFEKGFAVKPPPALADSGVGGTR